VLILFFGFFVVPFVVVVFVVDFVSVVCLCVCLLLFRFRLLLGGVVSAVFCECFMVIWLEVDCVCLFFATDG